MTRLILVRHGQSIANKESRFAGHSDYDLSPLGHEQAKLLAEYIAENEKIDAIYSSDLLRAHNTALPTAKKLGLPINDTTLLREIFAGSWESLEVGNIIERFPDDFGVWKNDFSNARCTGGESVREVYERVTRDIPRIAEQNDGKCLLIATHATVIRTFETYSKGLGADRVAEIPFCKNASVNIFEYDGGKVIPVSMNIHGFLGELVTPTPKTNNSGIERN